MRRLAWLAAAVVFYSVAAWSVAPGFYDGFGPPQPYNFTCPPPQAGANTKPSSAHLDIKIINGVSDANSAFTDDGQIVIGFLPGAFDVTGKTGISVDITPLDTCPKPPGIEFVTNVYRVTADAPLVKESGLTVRYSNLLPDPAAVYQASDPNGPWTSLGRSDQAQPYTVNTRIKTLGYFAAGYPSTSPAPDSLRVGGGQTLPIVVAVLIVVVVLASLPLAIVRRRRGSATAEDEEED